MNGKRSSPIYMFGSPNNGSRVKVTGATYYNNNRKQGGNLERIRRKTEPTESIPIPPKSPGNSPRGGSPSGGVFYAGAKFSEPPSPATLPTPPIHWVGECRKQEGDDQYREISNQLKLLLNIRA